ncbi:Hypothetical predicted protein [Mytilus galloprovincialis]|uniref:Uncharacterized protein n=1 Tax=Mytilus galloprovincialis TaxID=29158 RepID=A0A8B6G0E9_MYTGA|nr:Hypothetical predicted protein [Mytilus galloprovincialis]
MDLTDEEVQRNSFQKAKNEYQTEDKEVLGLEINTMIKIDYCTMDFVYREDIM